MQAVRREPHPVQAASGAADLLEAPGGTDPERPVVLRSQRITTDERSAGRTDFVFPTELRVPIDGSGKHEHARQGEGRGIGDPSRRVANLLHIAAKLRSLD